MIACICFHRGNARLAGTLCERIAELGGVEKHKCLLCVDEKGIAEKCLSLLEGVFSSVAIYVAHEKPVGWPARENALIANVARKIYYGPREAWLRVEPDSVPVSADWLDRIVSVYLECGKPIMVGQSSNPGRFCGAAVFPLNLHDCSIKVMMPDGQPWFSAARVELMKHAVATDLMSESGAEGAVLRVRVEQTATAAGIARHCIVQLGRLGDILNILPLVKHLNDTEGKPVLMVHSDYADIAQGLDYCDAEIFNEGAWSDLSVAVDIARSKYARVSVAQIHGDRWQVERKSPSFCIESWRSAGHEGLFGTPSLSLPRNESRERDLVKSHIPSGDRPTILVSLKGTSSPLSRMVDVLNMIDTTKYQIVDLSRIHADRFQDFLGLYDAADMLVSIDTATLHLTEASDIPVIALIADTPTAWHGSTPKGNCVLSLRYGEIEKRREDFLAALTQNRRDCQKPVIHHVFQDFEADGDTLRRNTLAALTWEKESVHSRWISHPFKMGFRSTACIGDPRKLPFVKDMVDRACDDALPEEWILLTNTDTCLRPGVSSEISRFKEDAIHGHRRDFKALTRPLTSNEILTGQWYAGSDLFAFRASWWAKHSDIMPDMVYGAEAWDWIFRQHIIDTGGGEIHTACYHERHPSHWEAIETRRIDAANRWNRCLAREYLALHGHALGMLAEFNDEMPEIIKDSAPMPKHDPFGKPILPLVENPLPKKKSRPAKKKKRKTRPTKGQKRTITPEHRAKLIANIAKARAAKRK